MTSNNLLQSLPRCVRTLIHPKGELARGARSIFLLKRKSAMIVHFDFMDLQLGFQITYNREQRRNVIKQMHSCRGKSVAQTVNALFKAGWKPV